MSAPFEILPYLFLSSHFPTQSPEILESINCQTIINTALEIPHPDSVPSTITYHHLKLDDNPQQNISQYFNQVFDLIGITTYQ